MALEGLLTLEGASHRAIARPKRFHDLGARSCFLIPASLKKHQCSAA